MATPELRHMLRDDDLNHEEQKQVLELAIKFHNDRFYHQPFAGPQGIAVIFDKPSTRTRSSFSIGVAELGGYPLVIDKSGSQLGRGEPVADTARVLDRMAYGVVWRTFGKGGIHRSRRSPPDGWNTWPFPPHDPGQRCATPRRRPCGQAHVRCLPPVRHGPAGIRTCR